MVERGPYGAEEVVHVLEKPSIRDAEKAAKYLDLQANTLFARVPPIKKARADDQTTTSVLPNAADEPIAKHEVKVAVFRASPDKAPGRDGLPARMWRELWPALENEITMLFTRSLETDKVP
ncbi:hypothetical protein K469DRAFT_681483 [Zopfia rhizophila CBS 207.26]|uniref:Uncharacterized protein n=1 Tax=Zopfia rhizophila CBS 207.26 TaxID=1314779 RepID=A0A6A6EYA9_9PEZI|nr:hypothetical protein K469DRAFT_681483 [Zopfia rhizophila CBS 207.26]